MEQTSAAKRYIAFGILFGILALVFVALYYFDVIENLDQFLLSIYVVYFVGVALVYNGAYCKEKNHSFSKILSYMVGTALILLAVGLLVYGFATGEVTLLN